MAEVALDASFWQSSFAKSVFRVFATARQSAQDAGSGGGQAEGSTSIEIEGRIGDVEAHRASGRFSPGCSHKFFSKLQGFFFKQRPATSETYDVAFRGGSNLRVSVQVGPGGELSVAECILKQRDSVQPVDAHLKGVFSHDFRVSIMVERKVPPEEFRPECTAALKWVHNLLCPGEPFLDEPTRLLSLSSGFPCEIAQSAQKQDIKFMQGPREFEDATGWLQPQIQWTLLAPTHAPTIAKDGYVQFHQHHLASESQHVVIGNVPGLLFTATGASLPLSAFEIVLSIPAKYLTPTILVNPHPDASSAGNLGDVFVRHKRRWKHVFASAATKPVLDLTETRQGASHIELRASPVKYEVEVERSLTIDEARNMDAYMEVGEFMKCISDVLFMSKLRFELSTLRAAFANLGPAGHLELGRSAPKRMLQQQQPPPVTIEIKRARVQEEPSAASARGDGGDEAQSFYNSLSRNREDRHRSRIFHMRAFNNFAKSRLLERYGKTFARDGIQMLELACGKGGDLNKIKKSLGRNLVRYLGTDIAKQSLEDAVQRLGNSGPLSNMARFVAADLTQCDLSQDDWGHSEGLEVWEQGKWTRTSHINSGRFNFISMQFALHYMFRSEDVVNRFFAGVSSCMIPGARFVATTVSADALISALLDSPLPNQIVFRDEADKDVCSIEFDEDSRTRLFTTDDSDANTIGLRYRFKLFDGESEDEKAVDAPEFVVANPALSRLAERYGLRIVEQCRLGDFALKELQESEDAVNLWRQMRVSNQQGTLSEVEWKIVNLYQVVVFEKTAAEVPPYQPPMQSTAPLSTAPAAKPAPAQQLDDTELYLQVIKRCRDLPEFASLSAIEKNEMVEREVAKAKGLA